MFESIRSAAEVLPDNVGQSRRGFLGRLGQAAPGAAGVLASLLALPPEAQAGTRSGYCEVIGFLRGSYWYNGYCICSGPCVAQRNQFCSGPASFYQNYCGARIGYARCTCT